MSTQSDSAATLLEPSHSGAGDGAGFSRWCWLLFFWLAAALIMASHRPSGLLQPQFWAEDGRVWYGQAYQQGPLQPLFQTQAGYIQTFPRLIADLTLLVPLSIAPFIMNLVAVLVEALPAVFLLSSRAATWASFRVRVAMAVMYLCLPNSAEWHGTVTNSMWVFTILILMILLAPAPLSRAGRAFDLGLIVIGGLTGPFSVLFVPIAWAMAWYRRDRWRTVYATIITAQAILQGLVVIASGRGHLPLGASLRILVNILGVRIFLSSLTGSTVRLMSPRSPFLVPLAITVGALLLIGAALWRSPLEIKLFALFCLEMLVAELRAPLINPTRAQWPDLLHIGGSRYYLFPMLGFLFCVGRLALQSRPRWLQVVCISLLGVFPLGAVRDWRDYAHSDNLGYYDNFRAEVNRFEAVPRGATVTLRIDPARQWTMTLTKH